MDESDFRESIYDQVLYMFQLIILLPFNDIFCRNAKGSCYVFPARTYSAHVSKVRVREYELIIVSERFLNM